MSLQRRLCAAIALSAIAGCSAPPPPEKAAPEPPAASPSAGLQDPSPLRQLQSRFSGPVSYFPRREWQREQLLRQDGTIAATRNGAPGETCNVPTHGTVNILVLPVIVSDYATPPANRDTAQKLHDFLFSTEGSDITLAKYFASASRGAPGGALTVTGTVKEWKSISHSNQESSQNDGSEYVEEADPIVQRALQAFDAEIDFADFDSDADGCIDWLMIVHSGPDQAMTRNPKDVWSHYEYYWPNARSAYDAKTAWSASVISAHSPIGIFAHEFAHNLGLPDLYSFGPPNKSIVGYWSLMDMGTWSGPASPQNKRGQFPTGIDPYGLLLLGWATPTVAGDPVQTVSVTSPNNAAPAILKVPLPALTSPAPADHYLLIEARLNAAARGGATGFVDDYLPTSGVLVWEIDEGGINCFGELRQAVTVADAYPNESIKGIAPEALLNDAPYKAAATGVSSTYQARGVRLDVLSAVANGYQVKVSVDSTARPELKAKFVRVTSDPHELGQPLTVDVDVTNVGAATAGTVEDPLTVEIAPLPGNAWTTATSYSMGTLLPGQTKTATWTATLATPGHLDLYATVSAANAAKVVIREKGFVNGKISQFDLLDSTSMGAEIAPHAPAVWDEYYYNCVATENLGAPLGGFAGFKTWCADNPASCAPCAQYDFATLFNNGSTYVSGHYCWEGGGLSPCRGEVTKVWIEDFFGNGEKEILVLHRDQTNYAKCVVESCTNDGVEWKMLTMFKLTNGQLQKIWEFSAPESDVPPWHCGGTGVGPNAAVVDLGAPYVMTAAPGTTPLPYKSIILSGFCGGPNSVIFYPKTSSPIDGFDEWIYGTAPDYSNLGLLGFDPAALLAQGENVDGVAGEDFLIRSDTATQEPQFFRVDRSGPRPTFSAAAKITSAAQWEAAYQAEFGVGTHLDEYVTIDGSPRSLAPKAFYADVNQDDAPDIVLGDGNGIDTGRLMVFDRDGATPRLEVVRRGRGNVITQLVPLDWDGDGKLEIVLGDNQDNSLQVYKYVEARSEFSEIFRDSFGGYTGTGYNPNIGVGDVDGNGTPDVVMGQGGHCSVPTVGAGVYVYGFGMVLRDGDTDGDGDLEIDPAGMGIFAIAVGDLDADGKDEIVAGAQNGQLYVLRHRQVDSAAPAVTEVTP